MPTYKADNGKWYAICWYSDWQGNRKQKCKRGFASMFAQGYTAIDSKPYPSRVRT